MRHIISWLQAHQVLVICGILYLFVLLFRVQYTFTHIIFDQDQARDSLLIESMIKNGTFIVGYGPKTSVGNFYVPPLYYQLHLVASLLTGSAPLAMHWVVVVLESFTPVVLYLLLRLFFKHTSALLAAVVYALSPLVMVFSTAAWSPNLIPLFTTLAFYSWCLYLFKGQKWAIIMGCVSLACASHFHFQIATVVPFAAFVGAWSVFYKRDALLYWIIGGLIGLATFMPYLYVETQNNWQNTTKIVTFFTQEHSHYYDRISKPQFVLEYIPGLIDRIVTGKDQPKYWIGRIILWVGFGVLGLMSLIKTRWRWLFLYFICIFVMLRVFKGDKHDYYLMTLFLFPAVIVALLRDILPKLTLPLICVIMFLMGYHYSTVKKFNDLARLEETATFLAKYSPTSNVKVIFHNRDHINTFAYGLQHFTDLTLDRNSTTVIDVCEKEKPCLWELQAMSKYNKGYEYSTIPKSETEYKALYHTVFRDKYQVVIGSFLTPPPLINPPYEVESNEYGTDLLLKEVY